MTTNHSYSFSVLQGDYFRAFVGLIICLAPYVLGAELVGAVSILLGCAALFAVYGLRTIFRQKLKVVLNENELTMKVFKNSILPWEKLSDLRLSYFSTWRSGGKGWMQLRLKGAGKTMRFESTLSDFETVVSCAVAAAVTNKLELNSTTLQNIDALNIEIPNVRQAA